MGLTEEQRDTVRRAVAELPPMSEDQVTAVCAMLNAAHTRRQRRAAEAGRTPSTKPPSPRPSAE